MNSSSVKELHVLEVGITRIYDDVLLVVEDRPKGRNGKIEEKPHTGRDRSIVPDVRHRRGELDVSHPFTAHLEVGYLDAAPVAYDAPVPDRFEFTAVTFPLLLWYRRSAHRTTVFFGTQSPVVDGLRFLNLAVGPRAEPAPARQALS